MCAAIWWPGEDITSVLPGENITSVLPSGGQVRILLVCCHLVAR